MNVHTRSPRQGKPKFPHWHVPPRQIPRGLHWSFDSQGAHAGGVPLQTVKEGQHSPSQHQNGQRDPGSLFGTFCTPHRPAAHVATWHMPSTGHAAPQPLQLLGSVWVSRQIPAQHVSAPGQPPHRMIPPQPSGTSPQSTPASHVVLVGVQQTSGVTAVLHTCP